ncbi:LmeA family phospholipid-binding protein [Streptomyces sp. HNM0575]|uniref:LmeA family phospholipid-binding protein n=1 Tax=Streptomyces sp. HNM0575 TaxID=2716338 RepID=UPI003217E21D
MPPVAPSRPSPYDALAARPDPRPDPGAGPGTDPGPAPAYGPELGTDGRPSAGSGLYGSPYDDFSGDVHEVYGEGPLGFTLRPDDDDHDDGSEEGRYDADRMPYLRAVRRRRASLVGRAVKTAVAVGVLLAFLFVGDRWAALYAENKAAEKVQSALKLHAEPEVHIGGFPFLTQVGAGRLDHVDIAVPDMPAGRISVAQVRGSVDDVRIVGGAPSAIKGAVLGRMKGYVLLDFDDLDRELGTSQVDFTDGGHDSVLAHGELPVAGKRVEVGARAHLRRTGDHGVGTTVDRMRLRVPGLFSYTPGDDGGLRLARPVAERIRRDAAEAKALFRVGAVAKRFGLTPERAALVRRSETELRRTTGAPRFVDKLMKINMLDVLLEHPSLLKRIGVDPALIQSLKKIEEPKLAEKLSLSVRLPKVPGDVRLREISVEKDGIRAKLTGSDMPFGGASHMKQGPAGQR